MDRTNRRRLFERGGIADRGVVEVAAGDRGQGLKHRNVGGWRRESRSLVTFALRASWPKGQDYQALLGTTPSGLEGYDFLSSSFSPSLIELLNWRMPSPSPLPRSASLPGPKKRMAI